MKDLERLTRQALELPLDQRAQLTDRLLESLESLTPEDIETLWVDEADRRFHAYLTGRVESFPGEDVHREILDELK